ncbi:MAG: hypothetical protein RMH97_07985, partial [Verrucomicrobiales bacterium]|nr:hypothetical protein [Verrucomicrobiales bacterium]
SHGAKLLARARTRAGDSIAASRAQLSVGGSRQQQSLRGRIRCEQIGQPPNHTRLAALDSVKSAFVEAGPEAK